MTNNVAKKSKRIFYFDVLRALAIFCVIMVHTITLYKYLIFNAFTGPTLSWIMSQLMYNPLRIGVLLFLMLSGALSLGRRWEVKSFLSKRIPRIVYPFIFWNVVFIIIFIILSKFGFIHVVNAFDLDYIFHFVIDAFIGAIYAFNANWFFWMILGTYLIMPVFNKWLLISDLKEVEYFLVLWLITCIFTFTLGINFPIKLTYFFSPIGLVVAGYYLRYTDRKFLNNPCYALIIIVITVLISMYCGYLRSSPENLFYYDRYSIFNTVIAISVFLMFKNFSKFNLKVHLINFEKLFCKLIMSLAKYSYGVYLVHYPIIYLFRAFIPQKCMPYGIVIVSSILVGIFFSMGILAVLNRVPHVNEIIGVK